MIFNKHDCVVVDGGRIAEGIVCPAQTEKDDVSCATCGLCWNSSEPIVFLVH